MFGSLTSIIIIAMKYYPKRFLTNHIKCWWVYVNLVFKEHVWVADYKLAKRSFLFSSLRVWQLFFMVFTAAKRDTRYFLRFGPSHSTMSNCQLWWITILIWCSFRQRFTRCVDFILQMNFKCLLVFLSQNICILTKAFTLHVQKAYHQSYKNRLSPKS